MVQSNKHKPFSLLADEEPDFGNAAKDYAKYRQGFPQDFFKRLFDKKIINKGQDILDIGTGTGTIARGLAHYGCNITAIDPKDQMLKEARSISITQGYTNIDYRLGTAEQTNIQNKYFDIITVGQAWHWFDHNRAIAEIKRLLKPDGRLIIAHFDWIPVKDGVAELSESLMRKYNRKWLGFGGVGLYPQWVTQLEKSGFNSIETYVFDVDCIYTHDAWRGRVRASAAILGGNLPLEIVNQFDTEHAASLKEKFSQDELTILHRCFTLIATLVR